MVSRSEGVLRTTMNKLFVVTTYQPENDTRLEQAIMRSYADDHYAIGRGQWMIAAKATATEVAEKLGIMAERGPVSGVYVVCIDEYFGHAKREMGEWMDAKAPRRSRDFLKGLFRRREMRHGFLWQTKQVATNLSVLLLIALVSFLAVYLILHTSHSYSRR